MERNHFLHTSMEQLNQNNYYLNNWLFHYNPYTNILYAFDREDHSKYFNDGDCFTIKSKHINVLVELITRANGVKDKIKDVIY